MWDIFEVLGLSEDELLSEGVDYLQFLLFGSFGTKLSSMFNKN